MLAEGITSVHDAGIDLMNAEVYLSMADNKLLDMRIYAMTGGAGEVLDAIGKPIRGYGNDHLDIASVKIYSDGALGSRGAAMIEPYTMTSKIVDCRSGRNRNWTTRSPKRTRWVSRSEFMPSAISAIDWP